VSGHTLDIQPLAPTSRASVPALTTIESSDAAGSGGDEEQSHKRIPERKQVTPTFLGQRQCC
jgi:hypothetical protein